MSTRVVCTIFTLFIVSLYRNLCTVSPPAVIRTESLPFSLKKSLLALTDPTTIGCSLNTQRIFHHLHERLPSLPPLLASFDSSHHKTPVIL